MNKKIALIMLAMVLAVSTVPVKTADAVPLPLNCEEAFYNGFDQPYGPDCVYQLVNNAVNHDGFGGGEWETW